MTSSSLRLAAADRLLLRSVFAWAKANGWTVDSVDDQYHQWRNRDGWTVDAYLPSGPEMTVEAATRRFGVWYPTSVTQAVDVLVALGILPAHFSSAFTAGRESLLREPNDIEATGGCCCNGCIGQGRCDLWDPYDPPDADERAENDAERIAEMTPDELAGWGK